MAGKPMSASRARDIETYLANRADLEAQHLGEYLAIADGKVIGVFKDFAEACLAVEQYPSSLVLEVGDEPVVGPLRVSSSHRKLGR